MYLCLGLLPRTTAFYKAHPFQSSTLEQHWGTPVNTQWIFQFNRMLCTIGVICSRLEELSMSSEAAGPWGAWNGITFPGVFTASIFVERSKYRQLCLLQNRKTDETCFRTWLISAWYSTEEVCFRRTWEVFKIRGNLKMLLNLTIFRISVFLTLYSPLTKAENGALH